MLPIRPLSRQCMSLSLTRPFDHAVISSRLAITALSQYTNHGVHWKRHFLSRILDGFRQRVQPAIRARPKLRAPARQGLLASVEDVRSEGLDTEASQSASARTHTLATIVPRGSEHHHDLDSFVEYTTRTGRDETTNVYRGTYHEYNTARALEEYGFSLERVGRANDLGIDLLGYWRLPMAPHEIKIVVQCKATQTRPALVRELEGACQGAPLGWRGRDVMALLVSDRAWTPGVQDAIERSSMPLGFMVVTREGVLEQFYWNAAAADAFLTGLHVQPLHNRKTEMRKWNKRKKEFVAAGWEEHNTIALKWDDKIWKPSS